MKVRDIGPLGLRAIILPASLIAGVLAYDHCTENHGRPMPEVIRYHDAGPETPDGGIARIHALDETGLDPVTFGPEDEPMGPEQATPPLEQIVDESRPASDREIAQRVFRRYTIQIDLSTNTATLSYRDIARDEQGRWVQGELHEADATYQVVSGSRATPTQEGRFIRRRLLINPRWNMPESIIEENRDYYMDALDENGEPIYFHDGRFYVEPGPHNPLGRLFLPLQDGQGVHETNAPDVFLRRNRYLSHGCVRYQGIEDVFADILRHNDYQVFDVWRSWTEPVDGVDPADILEDGAYSPRLMVRMDPPVDIIVTRSP